MNTTSNAIAGTFRHTAAEYREKARASRQRSAESWERSDTDGFLSQWAADTMANQYDRIAEVIDDGGMIETLALFLDGVFASAHQGEGQWGFWWRLTDTAAEKFGKAFFNPSRAKNATVRDRAKGFTYGYIRVGAMVESKTGRVRPNIDDIREGKFDVVKTDGAYDGIDEMFAQD